MIPLADVCARDLGAWRELARGAVEPNPFFEPESILPAARHLAAAKVALVVVKDPSGAWIACLPVTPRLQRRRARIPVLTGWQHRYAFLGTPLVARSHVEDAAEHLVETLLRWSRLGILALPQIGDDGPVADSLLRALVARGGRAALHRSYERPVIRRSTLAGTTGPHLSSRHRRDVGRLARRLAEELDAPLEVSDHSQADGAVDTFMALEASGWKGLRGTALGSQAADRAFFRGLCHGFRAAGRLQLLGLGTPDRTVSYKCNLLAGDAVFCFKIAFDAELAHYRPGLQLELRMLDVFRDGMSQGWMDSCADSDSGLFTRLWPDRRRIGSCVLTGPAGVGPLMEWGSTCVSSRRRTVLE